MVSSIVDLVLKENFISLSLELKGIEFPTMRENWVVVITFS